MATVRSYMPILKCKQGELGAIEELDPAVRQQVVPLFEVVPMPEAADDDQGTGLDKHLASLPAKLAKSLGREMAAFIDVGSLDPDDALEGGTHPLQWLIESSAERGVQLMPVTGLGRGSAHDQAALKFADRGLLIRLTREDLFVSSIGDQVGRLIEELQVRPEVLHLLMDVGEVSSKDLDLLAFGLRETIQRLRLVAEWRSLRMGTGAFPISLSEIQGLGMLPRADWLLWCKLAADGIGYADYGVQHPQPRAGDSKFSGSANIRYTAASEWWIFRGRDLRRHGFEQYYELCETLRSHPVYQGRGFSRGDQYIHDCACGDVSTGNGTTWRKVGTNHHIAMVVSQLAKLSGT